MAFFTQMEIAQKLMRYTHFIESEIARCEAMGVATHLDADAYIGLAKELQQTREMIGFLCPHLESA